MAQGGARLKFDYIQEHYDTVDLVVDDLQSDLDHNLLIAQLLHEGCDVEQSPEE